MRRTEVGRQDRGILFLVTALAGISALSMSIYTPSMPSIAAEFRADAGTVQRTLTLFLAGIAGAQLILGPISDRLGRKPVLIIGLGAYIAASLLCAFAPTIEALQTGRFLQGFAACSGPVVARAIVRDTFDGPDAARAFSIVATAIAVVPAMAPVLGGYIEALLGWVWVFIALASIGTLLLILGAASFRESLEERNLEALAVGDLARNYCNLLKNRHFMANTLAGSLTYAGLFAYVTQAPFLFVDRLGVSPDRFGWLLAISVVAYAAGSYLSGRLANRLPPNVIVGAGLGVAGAGAVLLLLLAGELTLVRTIGPMCVFALGFGLVLPATIAQAMQPFPRIAGSASAMIGCLQMGAAGLASLLVPLFDPTTTHGIGWIATGCIAVAGAYYAFGVRTDRGDVNA